MTVASLGHCRGVFAGRASGIQTAVRRGRCHCWGERQVCGVTAPRNQSWDRVDASQDRDHGSARLSLCYAHQGSPSLRNKSFRKILTCFSREREETGGEVPKDFLCPQRGAAAALGPDRPQERPPGGLLESEGLPAEPGGCPPHPQALSALVVLRVEPRPRCKALGREEGEGRGGTADSPVLRCGRVALGESQSQLTPTWEGAIEDKRVADCEPGVPTPWGACGLGRFRHLLHLRSPRGAALPGAARAS